MRRRAVDAIVNAANESLLAVEALTVRSSGLLGLNCSKNAVRSVLETLVRLGCDMDVTFCCFSAGDKAVYERIIK